MEGIKASKLCNFMCSDNKECQKNGKCLKMWDEKHNTHSFNLEKHSIWRNCDSKCMKPSELCNGKCVYYKCQKDGKCLNMAERDENGDFIKSIWWDCNSKCIKFTELCDGVC